MRARHLLLTALCCSALVGTGALARGTIAIALPRDIGADGLAIGLSWNYQSTAEADAEALLKCRTFMQVSEAVRSLCAVMGRFDNQCVSVAMDPQPGTYGFGWAVAATQQEADRISMQNCRRTSSPDRASFCAVSDRQCDEVG